MKSRQKLMIIGAAMGLALMGSRASADLLLSGHTAGAFEPSGGPYTTVTNSADGYNASFRTGVPVDGSFQSGVQFNGQDFVDISNGSTFSLGLITYYNGITQIGTSSANGVLDFYLDLSSPAMSPILLTTINFGIDATVNSGSLIPDQFTATFTQPAPVFIDGQWTKFTINDLPASTEVDENTWVRLANVTVTYLSPVPEPSTYGLIGALGLVGLAGYRRLRQQGGLRSLFTRFAI